MKHQVSLIEKKTQTIKSLEKISEKETPVEIKIDINLSNTKIRFGPNFREALINYILTNIEKTAYYTMYIEKVYVENLAVEKLPLIVDVNMNYILPLPLKVDLLHFKVNDVVKMKLSINDIATTTEFLSNNKVEAINEYIECIISLDINMILYLDGDKNILENRKTGHKYYNEDTVHVKLTSITPPYTLTGFAPRLICEGEIVTSISEKNEIL